MVEDKTVTISKSSYNKMLSGLVVAIVLVSFAFGFILGGAGVGGIFTGQVTGTTGTAGNNAAAPDNGDNGVPSDSGPSTIDISGDPALGDENAKIRLIEFSDFQCPFCRRHYVQSYEQIKTNYIDTGKALFVFMNFPLSFHEGAEPFANAAECANEQGKWEEMHDKMFDEQQLEGSGTVPYPGDAVVKQWAADIGLNAVQFNSCFDSKKYQSEIDQDFQAGVAAGVSGTPSFAIGNDDIGYELVVGAQPYSVISQVIESQLTKV